MPIRQCVACRKRREKQELLRWTVDRTGHAIPDPTAMRVGRGGYLCPCEECLGALVRRSRKRDPDFRPHEDAFRLAIRGRLGQNTAGEVHENREDRETTRPGAEGPLRDRGVARDP